MTEINNDQIKIYSIAQQLLNIFKLHQHIFKNNFFLMGTPEELNPKRYIILFTNPRRNQ